MQRWKKFWKLRKQEDAVKLMLLFLLAGTAFLGNAVYNGVELYRQLHSPAEYVLVSNAQGGAEHSQLNALREIKQVTAVSHQRELPLTARENGKEAAFTCTELSGEYMEKAYGIRDSGAVKTFYMNQKAYRQLQQELDSDQAGSKVDSAGSRAQSAPGGKRSSDEGKEAEERQIRYLVEEETSDGETAEKERTAKVVLVQQGVAQEEPYVFSKAAIQRIEPQVRVCVGQQELEGGTAQRLEAAGFSLEQTQAAQEAGQKQTLQLVRLGYALLAGLLCLSCVWALWVVWKKGRRRAGEVGKNKKNELSR